MTQTQRYILTAALWMAAVMLVAFATAAQDHFITGWAILISQIASVFTGWSLLESHHERIVEATNREGDKVDRLAGAILGELGRSERPKVVRH